jgi:four helix bundle protein
MYAHVKMRDFRRLKVWEKAHYLTLAVYRATSGFPKEELYGLTSQLRRSASSVPANIAEGCGRDTDSDFARFLQIAMGSASELEYHLLLARDLKLLGDDVQAGLAADVVELKRMLGTLIRSIRPAPPRNLELMADG